MSDSSNTIRLHRVLRAPAERVYKAFLDPDALCRWLPPFGYLGRIDRIDSQVGGSYHMSFTNFGTGHSHSFESTFLELIPGQRIRIADKFDDPGLEAEMTKTITLRTVSCGTELEIIHEGLPAAIPAEMCYLGWQESLSQLAQLVEPTIPDGE
ncbi:MAG: SRPBCC family protein [Pirellulaceae bacterium]